MVEALLILTLVSIITLTGWAVKHNQWKDEKSTNQINDRIIKNLNETIELMENRDSNKERMVIVQAELISKLKHN